MQSLHGRDETTIRGPDAYDVVSNLLYDATTEFSNSWLQTAPAVELADKGNIFGDDPLFVAAPANYALRTVSPCVGGAALLDWMTPAAVDVIGQPRIYGSKPDIGAFECQQGAGTLLLLR